VNTEITSEGALLRLLLLLTIA